jgi:hypothetical protein
VTVHQVINAGFILVPGLMVGIVWIRARIRNVFWVYFYGMLLILIGVAGWTFVGRDPIQLLLLEEAGGFGRAYLTGGTLLVSGLTYHCYRALNHILNGIGH